MTKFPRGVFSGDRQVSEADVAEAVREAADAFQKFEAGAAYPPVRVALSEEEYEAMEAERARDVAMAILSGADLEEVARLVARLLVLRAVWRILNGDRPI